MKAQVNLNGLVRQLVRLAATATPETLFAQLAKTVGAAFEVDGCIIASSTTISDRFEITCWAAALDAMPSLLTRNNHSEYMLERLLQPEPLIISGHRSYPRSLTYFNHHNRSIWQQIPELSKFSAVAVLEVPTQFQNRANGLISLMQSCPHHWTAAEAEALSLVADQIAAIISQVQLQQQVSLQLQHQAIVNQLTLAIRNSVHVNDILELATNETALVLQVRRGLLLRLKYSDPLFRDRTDEDMPKARVTVACQWSSEGNLTASPSPSDSFWLTECEFCQQAFKSPRSVAFIDKQDAENQTSTSEVLNGLSRVFNTTAPNSLLVAPLESQGTVLGFLVFQDVYPRSWQKTEVELVELVSAQVSTAIIQLETLRQVQSLVEKRTVELQHSLAIQAKLYERTRQQLDQLRQLNQLKDEFLDTVSHELRTPLTSMSLAIRMLRQVGVASDRSDRYLDILEQQCAQETNLINDLLALRELESRQVPLQLEPIDLVQLINDLADSFRQRWSAKGLTLELDFPARVPQIQSDRDSLNRILLELLSNAGKYSEPNTCIQLKLLDRREASSNQIILALSNIGSGISPEELPHIFEKFRRCQGITQNAIQGTGLGLALVKSLVQHLSGAISASSAPLSQSEAWETCFTLILPQSLSQEIGG